MTMPPGTLYALAAGVNTGFDARDFERGTKRVAKSFRRVLRKSIDISQIETTEHFDRAFHADVNAVIGRFEAAAPNQRWVGDTTEFVIATSGKLSHAATRRSMLLGLIRIFREADTRIRPM